MLTTFLSQAQLDFYRENGYVLTGRVVDDVTLDALRGEEERFRLSKTDDAHQLTIFRSQVCDFSQPVREFATRGPHLAWMSQLIGPNVSLFYNQFVTKFPDNDLNRSEFPWHQDNGYVSINPATNVTLWIALDDVDEENGCVWVMPKSHERGLLEHGAQSADSWFLNVPVEGDGVAAIMRAGEAVAFSGLTLHRSKLNRTDRIRRGFFLEYADVSATFGPDQTPVVRSPDSWVVCGAASLE